MSSFTKSQFVHHVTSASNLFYISDDLLLHAFINFLTFFSCHFVLFCFVFVQKFLTITKITPFFQIFDFLHGSVLCTQIHCIVLKNNLITFSPFFLIWGWSPSSNTSVPLLVPPPPLATISYFSLMTIIPPPPRHQPHTFDIARMWLLPLMTINSSCFAQFVQSHDLSSYQSHPACPLVNIHLQIHTNIDWDIWKNKQTTCRSQTSPLIILHWKCQGGGLLKYDLGKDIPNFPKKMRSMLRILIQEPQILSKIYYNFTLFSKIVKLPGKL